MMSALGSSLLFAWCFQMSWSQEALQHAGVDCFYNCWKTPGFCNWCGAGNACCRAGDKDADPKECMGPLIYQSNGQFHECVKASFLPGQAPPANLVSPASVSDIAKEQCISYMAEYGCGWTSSYSCPGQSPVGFNGLAQIDDSMGYKCCCTNGLWSESATTGQDLAPSSGISSAVQCTSYMNKHGCGWTSQYSCPGQAVGSAGVSHVDDSLGYKCCCLNKMWQVTTLAPGVTLPPASTTQDPNAFNIDAEMQTIPAATTNLNVPVAKNTLSLPVPTTAGFVIGQKVIIDQGKPTEESNFIAGFGSIVLKTPLIYDHAAGAVITMPQSVGHVKSLVGDTASGVTIGAGAQVGTNIQTGPSDPNFLVNHNGANVKVQTVRMVDPSFVATEHHGPIHNEFSKNDDKSKKERCQFGICADLDANDPDSPQAGTVHGLNVTNNTFKPPNTTNQLPSIVATVGTDDEVKVDEIKDGVVAPLGATSSTLPPLRIIPETTTSAAIAKGATVIPVQSIVGFAKGDQIMIGGVETTTIVGFGSILVNPPVQNDYPAGTKIQRVSTAATPPPVNQKAGTVSSYNSSEGNWISSYDYRPLIAFLIVCCLCCIAAAGAAFVMSKKQKKKKGGTDREAYLKNDFIERQPVYHEVPSQPEAAEAMPMLSPISASREGPVAVTGIDTTGDGRANVIVAGEDKNRDGIPDALEGDRTASALVQQLTAPPPLQPYQATASFPATVSAYAPQTTSSYMPYAGGYTTAGATYTTTPSTYLNTTMAAPTAYSNYNNQQLGMTGPLTSFPMTSVYR